MLGLADEQSGPDQLVDDSLELLLATRCEKPVERAELADLAEGAAQLRLEDHHERDQGDGEERLQQQSRQGEMQRRRNDVDEDEDHDSDQKLDSPGAPYEHEHVVDKDGNDEHVEHVVPAERLAPGEQVEKVSELPLDGIHQSVSARASTSAARSLRPSRRSA